MNSPEKEMSGEESLKIIQEMIQTAKTGIQDNGFFYLLWGWLVFIASISQYVLMSLVQPPYDALPWAILMPLGGIVSMIYGSRLEKSKKVKTYLDHFMGYVLTAFLVSLFIVLFFISRTKDLTVIYPLIMMVYGAWLFISGGLLKFKPLVIGGCINWALSICSMFVEFKWQLLVLALAVLLGYIIPGHLLKAGYQKE